MKVDKTKWEYKKLGDICQIQTGKLDANAKVENGQYPFFTCDYKPYRIDKYAFDTEAILISGNGSLVGHVNYYNGKFNAYQRTYVLTQFKLFYIPYLIIYLKRNLRPYIIQNKKGGCIPYITLPILKNFKILYPSLYEQRDIAAELDAVQKMIEGYKAQLADLDTLAQSIFLDMFGDPITNPKGWKKEYLSNICVELSTGPFGSMLHKTDYQEDGIPTINPQDIKGNKIKIDNIAKVSQEKAKVLFRYSLKENDIILARRGDLSKCAVITSKENGWLCGTGSFFLRLKNLLPIIFYYQYTTDSIQKYLNNKSAGATMPNLNQGILSQLLIAIPPLPLQQQFAERVESIERQKELLQAQLAEAQTLMAERMQYYFD